LNREKGRRYAISGRMLRRAYDPCNFLEFYAELGYYFRNSRMLACFNLHHPASWHFRKAFLRHRWLHSSGFGRTGNLGPAKP
jgi:hypothetical protein